MKYDDEAIGELLESPQQIGEPWGEWNPFRGWNKTEQAKTFFDAFGDGSRFTTRPIPGGRWKTLREAFEEVLPDLADRFGNKTQSQLADYLNDGAGAAGIELCCYCPQGSGFWKVGHPLQANHAVSAIGRGAQYAASAMRRSNKFLQMAQPTIDAMNKARKATLLKSHGLESNVTNTLQTLTDPNVPTLPDAIRLQGEHGNGNGEQSGNQPKQLKR